MKTYVRFALDGLHISVKEILDMSEWPDPNCKIMITPKPGDPFYGMLIKQAPRFIHLFVRALFEHEKQINRLHKEFRISADVHIELIIENSTRLQEVLLQEKTEFELFTPVDAFRSVIRKRHCDFGHYRMENRAPSLTRIVWNNDIPETTRQARTRFDYLRTNGYQPLKRYARRLGTVIDFPADDEEVVMVNPRQKPEPISPRNFPLEPLPEIYKRYKGLPNRKVVFTV